MTTLIGRRCTPSNGFSRPVLIGRGLEGYHRPCSRSLSSSRRAHIFAVATAVGTHPYPSRTRKLSPPAPMVLGSRGPGRVGRRRNNSQKSPATLRQSPTLAEGCGASGGSFNPWPRLLVIVAARPGGGPPEAADRAAEPGGADPARARPRRPATHSEASDEHRIGPAARTGRPAVAPTRTATAGALASDVRAAQSGTTVLVVTNGHPVVGSVAATTVPVETTGRGVRTALVVMIAEARAVEAAPTTGR